MKASFDLVIFTGERRGEVMTEEKLGSWPSMKLAETCARSSAQMFADELDETVTWRVFNAYGVVRKTGRARPSSWSGRVN